jgi:hypothetical protein
MAIRQVNVTAVATQLVLDHSDDTIATIRNTGANPVDVGPPGIVFGQGFTIAAGAEEKVDVRAGETLWGICGAALASVCDVSY